MSRETIEILDKYRSKRSIVKMKCIVCGEIFYSTLMDIENDYHKCKNKIKTEINKNKIKTEIRKKETKIEIKTDISKKKIKQRKKSKFIYEFRKIREEILKRDNYKCVQCGSDEMINVHHIEEKSKGGNNSKDNLETLCYKCHMEKHKEEPVYNLMKSRIQKTGK
jgi:5-methylcytosine-specific restriction endonuclease McrA